MGFDISGDERKENEWLSKVLAPLNDMSAAITIHAGESESVESIWKAVYQLHARRIGHGLRLLENGDLLQLFVEAGICVELCPYSNRITNGFIDSAPRLDEFPRLAEYPLREYQKHGLEVTIGTDNRHLHPKGHRTLTSEYLEAARMSGGLTRWEVLQIVKAGFKNAFVSKEERRAMLAAVEERLYEIVSGA